jgi:D-alanyl-D-alanine carboxypeptidase (penicillin-binding protein 5/6)
MKKTWIISAAVIALLLVFLYLRPVPPANAVSQLGVPPKTTPAIMPWPAVGQAAIGAQGYGLLQSHGVNSPLPIASVAKIITALAVLQKKPISAGGQGPTITFSQTDVDLFNSYYSQNGSVAKVQAGEQLTEYQALEAMLLPSANNLADSLANWAFGSVDAYVKYANQMVEAMGLPQTTVGDASGFTDSTTSTADDLVKLALAAISNPSIASAVKQQSVDLPITGTVRNTNWLLGQDGVIGIKTGNTDKAGGVYLFASQRQVLGRSITLAGAILGSPDLVTAIRSADKLIKTSDNGFQQVTLVNKGEVRAQAKTAWGTSSPLAPSRDLSLVVWKGQEIKFSEELPPIETPAKSGTAAGTITVSAGQQSAKTQLVLTKDLAGPSWHWRIIRK